MEKEALNKIDKPPPWYAQEGLGIMPVRAEEGKKGNMKKSIVKELFDKIEKMGEGDYKGFSIIELEEGVYRVHHVRGYGVDCSSEEYDEDEFCSHEDFVEGKLYSFLSLDNFKKISAKKMLGMLLGQKGGGT